VINIVCLLRSGGKVGYDASWVEKLQRGIARNLTLDHQFICLSDCEVDCQRIPLEDGDWGYWSKLQLFKPNQFQGPVMYFDLDTVICQNIDDVVDRIKKRKFVMWYEADKGIHSSAFMYWQGDYSHLWDKFKSKPVDYWDSLYSSPPLYGDQALISENTKHYLLTDHCPTEWFHIASRRDSDYDLSKVKILMFRKSAQKPSTMIDNELVKNHWI